MLQRPLADLDVGGDDHGAQRGDEVQDADVLDFVGVLAQLGAVLSSRIGSPMSQSTEWTIRARSRA
ncbi:hypothetical protein AMK32_36155 [Streptomyces sp. CB01883]|nr:hypothetical protein AMK32_36155 [Streptomyces sp. CB01883]